MEVRPTERMQTTTNPKQGLLDALIVGASSSDSVRHSDKLLEHFVHEEFLNLMRLKKLLAACRNLSRWVITSPLEAASEPKTCMYNP